MLTVFYGNQVYGEYPDWNAYKEARRNGGIPDEVHKEAVIHNAGSLFGNQIMWWHPDGRPIATPDVPAMCKAWVLIL